MVTHCSVRGPVKPPRLPSFCPSPHLCVAAAIPALALLAARRLGVRPHGLQLMLEVRQRRGEALGGELRRERVGLDTAEEQAERCAHDELALILQAGDAWGRWQRRAAASWVGGAPGSAAAAPGYGGAAGREEPFCVRPAAPLPQSRRPRRSPNATTTFHQDIGTQLAFTRLRHTCGGLAAKRPVEGAPGQA